MENAVHISVRLPVEIRKEDGRIVTSCFLLDAAQEGSNKPEALDALTDAVRSLLKSRLDSGSFDQMLDEYKLCPRDSSIAAIDGHYIEVSLMLTTPTQKA